MRKDPAGAWLLYMQHTQESDSLGRGVPAMALKTLLWEICLVLLYEVAGWDLSRILQPPRMRLRNKTPGVLIEFPRKHEQISLFGAPCQGWCLEE